MNLQDLVPPIELCKLIPKGEFEDSLHWYRWSWVDQKYLLDVGKPNVRLYREPCPCGMKFFYPAPTLQEILAELKEYKLIYHGVAPWIESHSFYAENENLAESALGLWLQLKGIENEKI